MYGWTSANARIGGAHVDILGHMQTSCYQHDLAYTQDAAAQQYVE